MRLRTPKVPIKSELTQASGSGSESALLLQHLVAHLTPQKLGVTDFDWGLDNLNDTTITTPSRHHLGKKKSRIGWQPLK